jgi:hypothetical protein
MSDGGKGSAQRPFNADAFNRNFETIFGARPRPVHHYRCSACGKPCRAVDRDFGYGRTEYWGSVSSDEDIQTVSQCCDGDLLDIEGDL